jgi:glutamate synthase domain-containing protein 2
LLFIHNTVVGVNLRDKIRLGASGKIISAFDMTSVFAIGADWVNCARGFMFAIGCIQSQSCHTNRCPTGVATQDKVRQRADECAPCLLGQHRRLLPLRSPVGATSFTAGFTAGGEAMAITGQEP